ncbi:MAG: hypothetical protein P0Y53_12110 [Candidatus Pseudobacter hemicellulosilyticus]|uniref:DUF4348 domain-containing protein n=1 Tax=Candidatus Pseudobacter hemicellulosilyticus TaxID=3121375 RepID=A0AAJ6BJF6_9BACT|nr:MAG: hypothetical protein P0Y53_12110 [Pseudobacter sp.]
MRTLIPLCLALLLLGCNQFTIAPRNKNSVRREKPSMLLCERIVDFRLEFSRWPVSREDFMGKGKKYYEVMSGIPYHYIHFKTFSDDKMNFTYGDHEQDRNLQKETNKIALNPYGGFIEFYKLNDRFVWKIHQ